MDQTFTCRDYGTAWGISPTKATQSKNPFWRKAAKLVLYDSATYTAELRRAIDEELAERRRVVETAVDLSIDAEFQRLAAARPK